MGNKEVMLITGYSGRVGEAIVQRLKSRYIIVGLDRRLGQDPNVDHVHMDITSDASVGEALEYIRKKYGNKLGVVIHLAAYYSFSGEHPELYQQITVDGTRRFLRALQSFEVGQFHFASTLLVYQSCPIGDKITEESPIDATWGYPKSKVATELVIHEERGHIPCVIMRIAGCYDNQCHSIPIGRNIQRIYERQLDSHLFPGDKRAANPYLHLEDLVDAYECCFKKREALPAVFVVNIGEDRTIPYDQLQNEISQILDKKNFEIFRIPKWVARAGAWVEDKIPGLDNFIQPWMIDHADDNCSLDITLAKEKLGWSPKHFLGTSLPVMMQLLTTDPIEWYKIQGFEMPEHLKKHIEAQKIHAE